MSICTGSQPRNLHSDNLDNMIAVSCAHLPCCETQILPQFFLTQTPFSHTHSKGIQPKVELNLNHMA
ncbi:hypothetical protein KL86DES1_20615 [uncultured Desulfovibrio sp.]|uniref:Uncharacterized protein n=1 Tax=uncultured Desulfovibrio sp. TaxID=167968 RepID=A0A212L4H1_9BACT|nr:hypothetical protein KL86DES1_20615 [uncultured Desulfovibrio sp.]VZH33518.1 conserved protein of unknown function [Desulfovibrio sp. 86]